MRPAIVLATLVLLIAPAAPADQEGLGLESRATLGPPGGAPLSGAELDEATEQVASLLRCPVCQGLSVADSPTDSALAMREEVRRLLAGGYTRAQVLDYFEQSYGEFIRLQPKAEGFNLFVWLLPVLGLLTGAALVAWRVRGGRRPDPAPVAAAEEDPELTAYRDRVRREVAS